MKRKGVILALSLMLLFATGCELGKKATTSKESSKTNTKEEAKKETKKEEVKKTITLTSSDGHFSLVAPDTWEVLEEGTLNKAAKLEIGATEASGEIKYGMILPDDAANFESFDTWYNAASTSASTNYKFDANEIKDVTINGYEAKYVTYNTTLNGYVFYMRLYFVKGTNYYSQMYFWSLASNKDKLDPEFVEMANTYKEL